MRVHIFLYLICTYFSIVLANLTKDQTKDWITNFNSKVDPILFPQVIDDQFFSEVFLDNLKDIPIISASFYTFLTENNAVKLSILLPKLSYQQLIKISPQDVAKFSCFEFTKHWFSLSYPNVPQQVAEMLSSLNVEMLFAYPNFASFLTDIYVTNFSDKFVNLVEMFLKTPKNLVVQKQKFAESLTSIIFNNPDLRFSIWKLFFSSPIEDFSTLISFDSSFDSFWNEMVASSNLEMIIKSFSNDAVRFDHFLTQAPKVFTKLFTKSISIKTTPFTANLTSMLNKLYLKHTNSTASSHSQSILALFEKQLSNNDIFAESWLSAHKFNVLLGLSISLANQKESFLKFLKWINSLPLDNGSFINFVRSISFDSNSLLIFIFEYLKFSTGAQELTSVWYYEFAFLRDKIQQCSAPFPTLFLLSFLSDELSAFTSTCPIYVTHNWNKLGISSDSINCYHFLLPVEDSSSQLLHFQKNNTFATVSQSNVESLPHILTDSSFVKQVLPETFSSKFFIISTSLLFVFTLAASHRLFLMIKEWKHRKAVKLEPA